MSRGDIWLCDFDPVVGSEQGGRRPAVVVSHDGINAYSGIAIVVPFTSRTGKRMLSTHAAIPRSVSGLHADSLVMAEQVRVVSKDRMVRQLGTLPDAPMLEIGRALKIAQGLD